MRRMVLVLVLLSLPVVIGQVCPVQQFLPMEELDPNQVIVDPETGQRCVFCKLYGYTGQPITIEGRLCDEDNYDPNYPKQELRVWREGTGENVPLDAEGYYAVTVAYTEEGWHYEHIGGTDGIAVRLGTVAIYTKRNHPPVQVCGGR